MVFVSLSRPPVGWPVPYPYPDTKGMFDRLTRAADHPFCAPTCCATPP
uniref:Uncharacterized protein n=1 Tax=Streptomyces sp. NBC_00180 TaxID=2903632 RepID=A0AAU1HW00_9ACTN